MKHLLPPFTRQLMEHPVEGKYNQVVLARMLTEVATADGAVGQEEHAMLTSLIPPTVDTVDNLLVKPPLSAVELKVSVCVWGGVTYLCARCASQSLIRHTPPHTCMGRW